MMFLFEGAIIVALVLLLIIPVSPFPVLLDYHLYTDLQRISLPRVQHSTAGSADEAALPTPSGKLTASVGVQRALSRDEGREIMNTMFLPEQEYGDRIEIGRDAQGLRRQVVAASDPRLSLTYGEFPMESLDELLDLALPHVKHTEPESYFIRMCDIGSGCGRLALYTALTRERWEVHGIEISRVLHDVAVHCLARGEQKGFFVDSAEASEARSSLHLHAGPASDWSQEVFAKMNLIFAYSTAWPTRGFSEEWRAMIIGSEWSSLLAKTCMDGCIIVTTDRALDPNDGFQLIDRLEVDNREVMGSTGYIHRLVKR